MYSIMLPTAVMLILFWAICTCIFFIFGLHQKVAVMPVKRVSWVFLVTAALTVSEAFSKQCSMPEDERFDCNPEIRASQKSCESRGCCWISSKGSVTKGSPRCFYPLDYNGYQFSEVKATEYGLTTNLTRTTSGHYPKVIKHLKMDLFFETSKRLHFKVINNQWSMKILGACPADL